MTYDQRFSVFTGALVVVVVAAAGMLLAGLVQPTVLTMLPFQAAVVIAGAVWVLKAKFRDYSWTGLTHWVQKLAMPVVAVAGMALASHGLTGTWNPFVDNPLPLNDAGANVEDGACMISHTNAAAVAAPMSACRAAFYQGGQVFAGAWLLFAAVFHFLALNFQRPPRL